jgi:hypothetical protein
MSEQKTQPQNNEELVLLRKQVSYLQSVIEATADPARLRHIKQQEIAAMERSGAKEMKVGIHTYNGRIVLSWSNIPPEQHKIYKNMHTGRWVEEIFIPEVILYDPSTQQKSIVKDIEYAQFHKTRGFVFALVTEKIDTKEGVFYKVKLEDTGEEFTIQDTFVN